MSIICQDENKRSSSGGANLIDVIVCIGRIGGCLEEEHIGEFGSRTIRI